MRISTLCNHKGNLSAGGTTQAGELKKKKKLLCFLLLFANAIYCFCVPSWELIQTMTKHRWFSPAPRQILEISSVQGEIATQKRKEVRKYHEKASK